MSVVFGLGATVFELSLFDQVVKTKMALLLPHIFVFNCLLRGFWVLMSLADHKGTQRGSLGA